MTIEQLLALADTIARELNTTTVRVGPSDRPLLVQGADANEVKKTFSFFCATRDLAHTLKLTQALQKSPFAQRTRRTEGYYRIIQQVIERHLSRLSADEALKVLGWACRLQTYYQLKG
jgi:hypothetical protein